MVLMMAVQQSVGELKWENQTWRDMFSALDLVDAEEFHQVSLDEIAAFVNFAEKKPHDLASWHHLTPEELVSWAVPDSKQFLKARPVWGPKLGKFAPELQHKQKGFMDDMPDWMQTCLEKVL